MTERGRRASIVGSFLLAIAAGAACSSGGKGTQVYPDAVAPGTGGRRIDGGGAPDGGSGGTSGVLDAATNVDASVLGGALRLLPGPAVLVGPGGVACSSATAPAGGPKPDQWCGVLTAGTPATTAALSVFNLTKAIAGTPLLCTAGDPNCIQVSASLGANLGTGSDAAHGFYGDTLIYYETGSVFAWRPGWAAGRVLVARDQIVHCEGIAAAATAVCVKATPDTTVVNLYAGRLDAETGPPLPLVEAISSTVGNLRFSPDGQSVLWSTAAAAGPETLKMQTIGDATTKVTVAPNVTGWTLTPDGLRWLWLSQPVTDATGLTTGTLQSAPYPAGMPPTTIQPVTYDYAAWSATGLFVLTNPGAVGADLRSISDISAPTTSARTLATQTVIGLQAVGPGGNILYLDTFDATNNLINLRAVKADATGACVVTLLPNADPSAGFTSTSTGVEWVRVTVAATGTATAQGLLTTLSDCLPHPFSTSPAAFLDVKAGLVLQESYNATAGTAALSYLPFATGGTLGPALVIHPAANPTIMALFPDSARVVYTVNSTLYPSGVFVSDTLGGTTLPFMPDMTQTAAEAPSMGVSSLRTARTALGRPLASSPFARSFALRPSTRSMRTIAPPVSGSVRRFLGRGVSD